MIYVLPSQLFEPHWAKPTFYLSPSVSSRKNKLHVCRPQWCWSSWPCIEKASFSKTLAASYLLAECDDANVNHNLENQNMFQCDVADVRRYSLRPTWPHNSIFGYLGDTLDTANSDCEGWSSFICSSLAVRTRRWWHLLSAAIYATDRWMNGSMTIPALVLWKKRIIIHISWWHLVLLLKLNYILPLSVVFLFLFRIN